MRATIIFISFMITPTFAEAAKDCRGEWGQQANPHREETGAPVENYGYWDHLRLAGVARRNLLINGQVRRLTVTMAASVNAEFSETPFDLLGQMCVNQSQLENPTLRAQAARGIRHAYLWAMKRMGRTMIEHSPLNPAPITFEHEGDLTSVDIRRISLDPVIEVNRLRGNWDREIRIGSFVMTAGDFEWLSQVAHSRDHIRVNLEAPMPALSNLNSVVTGARLLDRVYTGTWAATLLGPALITWLVPGEGPTAQLQTELYTLNAASFGLHLLTMTIREFAPRVSNALWLQKLTFFFANRPGGSDLREVAYLSRVRIENALLRIDEALKARPLATEIGIVVENEQQFDEMIRQINQRYGAEPLGEVRNASGN